jgi:2-oxoglutarate ferredoxin oxidoreductase subunit alpha
MKKNNKTNIIAESYNVLVGGAAGEGSRMAGLTIAKLLSNYGWRVSITEDYQSLIKGGHNFSIIRATKQRNASAKKAVDFLIALNKHTLEKHQSILDRDGIVIFNSDVSECEHGFGLSAKEITEKFKCAPIMKNSAFLGAFAKVIGMDFSVLETVFKKEIKKDYDTNIAIAKYGYDSVDTLEKIEKGEYGICMSCGEKIEKKRLEARPVTDLCIKCKEEQEKIEKGFAD